MNKYSALSLFFLALFSINASAQSCANFNSVPAGTAFTPINGNPTGTVIVSEAGMDFTVSYQLTNGGGYPLSSEVHIFDASIVSTPDLPNGNFLWFGDAQAVIDFTNLGYTDKVITMDVSSESIYFAVNGNAPISTTLSAAPANIAPGVTLQWTAGSADGGTVQLTGVVNEVKVGSFESGIDDVCVQPNTATSIDPAQALDFAFYPNPAADFLWIDLPSLASQQLVKMNVVDLNGRVQDIVAENGKINVSNLATGMYWLQVQTESGMTTKKFLKK